MPASRGPIATPVPTVCQGTCVALRGEAESRPVRRARSDDVQAKFANLLTGLTDGEVALAAGCARTYIGALRRGERRCELGAAVRIVAGLRDLGVEAHLSDIPMAVTARAELRTLQRLERAAS